MEAHLMNLIRFFVYLATVAISVLLMIGAEDNDLMRRLTALAAAVAVYFNPQIGTVCYLLLGALFETLFTAMGVLFLVILGAVIMVFPLVALVRWVIH